MPVINQGPKSKKVQKSPKSKKVQKSPKSPKKPPKSQSGLPTSASSTSSSNLHFPYVFSSSESSPTTQNEEINNNLSQSVNKCEKKVDTICEKIKCSSFKKRVCRYNLCPHIPGDTITFCNGITSDDDWPNQ